MKILFDFFPVALFFAAYQLAGIYVATGVAIAASVAQIGWLLARRRRVEPMMWISLAIIVIFGGATLILHDKTFIMWKPTVLYWVFSAVLFGAPLVAGRNLIRTLMEKEIRLPERVWSRLNTSWAAFFALMGCVNLYVAFNFSEAVWVKFKVFGLMAMMFVFVIGQGLLISRYLEESDGS